MAFDYPVILSKRGERFLASFPDFPGCYGEGSDRLDAMAYFKNSKRETRFRPALSSMNSVSARARKP